MIVCLETTSKRAYSRELSQSFQQLILGCWIHQHKQRVTLDNIRQLKQMIFEFNPDNAHSILALEFKKRF